MTEMFHHAHELGLFTVLWCYLRNPAFKTKGRITTAADLTGQANHLGVTIEADIIKRSCRTPTADSRRSTSARPTSASTRSSRPIIRSI